MLFLIYINELPNSSKILSFYLFADDANIYFESDDLPKLVKIVNKELKRVKSWLYCNKLTLNSEKTNFLLFRSSRRRSPDFINNKIGNKPIRRTNYVKFLDILIDEHLSWKYHASELHKTLSKTADLSLRLGTTFPNQLLFHFITQFSLPFLSMVLLHGA